MAPDFGFAIMTALRLLEGQSTREQIDGLTDRFSRFKQQFDRGVSVQSAATLETLLKDMGTFSCPSIKRSH
jgi:hypothetical protein